MNLSEGVEKFESEIGFGLPAPYREFLLSHDGTLAYARGHEFWRLKPVVGQGRVGGLLSEARVDNWKGPMYRLLEGYAQTLREFMGACTSDQRGKAFPLDRLAQGIAIGTENSDIAFLDATSDFSVWRFFPDGGDVKKLSPSFGKWLKNLKPEQGF